MTLELGSLLGAIALIGIPIATWLSRRFTREARILSKIDRFGDAYAKLPDSPERDVLAMTLTRLAHDLNAWTTTETVAVRRWRFWSTVGGFVLAVGVAVWIYPSIAHSGTLAFAVYAGLGLSAGVLSTVSAELVERRASRRVGAADRRRKEAAFRAGTTLARTPDRS